MGVKKTVPRRLRRAAFGVLGAFVLVMVAGRGDAVRADINGDGTDEIGAFAVEVTGLARGPWYQVYEADGSTVATQFMNAAFSSYQFLTVDLDGNGSEELVSLSLRNSDGASLLDARMADGTQIDAKFVTGAGFSNFQIFPINHDGGAASELGIGFVQDSDGVAFYQIWRLNGGTLTLVTGVPVLGSAFDSHFWGAADFDNDTNEEIFVGFRQVSDGAAAFQVWETSTGMVAGAAFVTGTGFNGHQWILGDFDSAQTGAEIMVGFTRTSDGASVFQVWRGLLGTLYSGRFVTGAGFSGHKWAAIGDGTDEQAFVGFKRDSDGFLLFQVWDPGSLAAPTGAAFVLPGTFDVAQWVTGNFDGLANGDEVVIGFVQKSDGQIGFQHWSRAGAFAQGVFALAGTFYNPSFVGLHPFTSARDDILVGATSSTGQPVIQIWDPSSGVSLLSSQLIFNTDVR